MIQELFWIKITVWCRLKLPIHELVWIKIILWCRLTTPATVDKYYCMVQTYNS